MSTGIRTRSCATIFSYVGTGSQVSLAGEWDWDNPEPMTPAAGVWQISKDLSAYGPGPACYKIVVDGQWMLDPANPYQAYCDGVQNSGVRVPDCQVPQLTVEGTPSVTSDGFSARILFSAAAGATADRAQPDTVTATLVHAFTGDTHRGDLERRRLVTTG